MFGHHPYYESPKQSQMRDREADFMATIRHIRECDERRNRAHERAKRRIRTALRMVTYHA